MLRIILATLSVLLAVAPESAAQAQSVNATPARTAKGAITFISEMLARGPAEVKPWPGFVRLSAVTAVSFKQSCQMVLTLNDKSSYLVDLSRALSVRSSLSTNEPQSFVEITGGMAAFRGLDIYVGDNASVRRVGEALEFLRASCDKNSATGF